jgi:N-acetylglucosamine-6-phosphate deacetylase
MYRKVGVPLPECILMLCWNPLRIMGVGGKGKLQPGYDADLVVFDEEIRIKQVYLAGKRIPTESGFLLKNKN